LLFLLTPVTVIYVSLVAQTFSCPQITVCANATPPVLVVIPRQWRIPVNEETGQPVAEVRVTHYGGEADKVEYTIQKSTVIAGLGLKDGSQHFSLHRRGPNALKVYLTKSLEGAFAPGDQLTLSIAAQTPGSSFTSRHEVHVIVEPPHANPFVDNAVKTVENTTARISIQMLDEEGNTDEEEGEQEPVKKPQQEQPTKTKEKYKN